MNFKTVLVIKPCLAAMFLVIGLGSIEASSIVTYSGPGDRIPDADSSGPGVKTFDIVVGDDAGTICSSSFQDCGNNVNNVTVSIQGLQHSSAGDLIATLTAVTPSISRDIFNRILVTDPTNPFDSGCGCLFDGTNGTYNFSEQSPTYSGDIWGNASTKGSGETINPGFYWTTSSGSNTPTSFSTAFNGMPATGVWRLTISDNSPGDVGSFSGWTLSLNLVPEPSFVIPSGLAIFGLVLFGRSRLSVKRQS